MSVYPSRSLSLRSCSHFLLALGLGSFLAVAPAAADPIHDAAEAGDAAQVEVLIDGGADVEARDNLGRTVLLIGVEQGDVVLVELALAKGADVNATRKNGTTALHLAAEHNRLEIAKILVAAGGNPNATFMGFVTPVMLADGKGNKEVSAYLKEQGGEFGKFPTREEREKNKKANQPTSAPAN